MSLPHALRLNRFISIVLSFVLSVVLAALVLGGVGVGISAAQTTNDVYLCIVPATRNEYLIPVRGNNLFGIVIPETATVTVYSPIEVAVSLHPIVTNARTGGYLPSNAVAAALTSRSALSSMPCRDDLEAFGLDVSTLLFTVPIPTSIDHMLAIQIGTDDRFAAPTVLGAAAISFQQNLADFQIIQLRGDTNTIEISFPFLDPTADLNYIVIGNKTTSLTDVFVDGTTGQPVDTEERNVFINRLTIQGLNLYTIVSASKSRLYPHSGRVLPFLPGTYVRIGMSPIAAERVWTANTPITFLDGRSQFCLISVDDASVRNCQTAYGQTRIVEVNDGGQLIITFGGPNWIVEEAWLAEPAAP